ncbi:hypothetical protein F0562_015558 [Nyssa sinensis]|uniref:AAA+ ATPase domain-containing protein n=1 Tax=Nyssa sinensis TaxID=561372 RepID=A0A5J4ZJV1_9ASTE|nr:hypothetical protein F0562_015558 [Nyssa sinensis]
MANTFLFGIVREITQKLASLAADEVALAWGLGEELRRLEDTATTIEAVLLDAEEQQVRSRAVREWLRRLQDVVCDITNVVDDIATEALRRQVENQITDKVTRFLSKPKFQLQMGHKIGNIRKRLDEISADARQFNFINRDSDMPVTRERETYSYVRQSEVAGRDNDTENIVKELLGDSSNFELSVIAIVGIGGLGKTTLAKCVYDDKRVKAQFDLKEWVYVSSNFNLRKIIENIIENQNPDLPLERLQILLRQKLEGKKFLFVLDDVWITNPNEWIDLRDLLMVGAKGSKILTTTRSESVSRIVGCSVPYKLQGLSDDDSTSLFMKCAFEERKDKEHPNLVAIGKEIAKKCKGVPLAVKTLGGMLFSKTEEKEWVSVLNNDIWKLDESEDGIMHALRLSFDQLPSFMKRCFAYCAIYEKGDILCEERLIQLWMAQGFIQSEDIGSQCFNELSARSFFEDVNESDSEIMTTFKMHDLMHDLARSVIGTEFSKIQDQKQDIPKCVRHVLLARPTFPELLLKFKMLWTFKWLFDDYVSLICVDPIIFSFRYLRVLDLYFVDFEELPSSIKKLKYLRFLNLFGNSAIKRLPTSICKLYNLQTLILSETEYLKELPKDTWKLISLRHLSVTSQQKSFPERGIGCLTSLLTLSISASRYLESLPNSMQNLTVLEDLEFSFCTKLCLSRNDMKGLYNLQRLSITNLPRLVRIPLGLQHAATTLKCLYIGYCLGLIALPEWLGTFASLRRLTVINCLNLTSLPQDPLTLVGSLKFFLVCVNDSILPKFRFQIIALFMRFPTVAAKEDCSFLSICHLGINDWMQLFVLLDQRFK